MQKPTVALAFSGGLDTSYCVPRLAEQGFAVHTVYVNTGGATAEERAAIAQQARAVGAVDHHEVDARATVFDRFVRYLIQGNVLRGEVYPLSVSAERTQQAISVIDVARQIGARAVAHGSTGAGNDQVRFDVAFRVLAPDLAHHHPDPRRRRSPATGRSPTSRPHGLPVPPKSGAYSINRGLWGTTWGGGWTHDTWAAPPHELLEPPADAPAPREIVIAWETGRAAVPRRPGRSPAPTSSPSWASSPKRTAWAATSTSARPRSASRAGSASRPGAALVLIAAHRELEKLVLTKWQTFWKDQLGRFYGDRLHEGHYFDPALRDIEALLTSSQQRVTGETRVHAGAGTLHGDRHPEPVLDDGPAVATYGEENRLWTGEEARAFAAIGRDSVASCAGSARRRDGSNRQMVRTTRVRLDRIASSTRNARLVPRGDRRRRDRGRRGLRARGAAS